MDEKTGAVAAQELSTKSKFQEMREGIDIGTLVEITLSKNALYTGTGGRPQYVFTKYCSEPKKTVVGYIAKYEEVKGFAENVCLSIGWNEEEKGPVQGYHGGPDEGYILRLAGDAIDSFKMLKRD